MFCAYRCIRRQPDLDYIVVESTGISEPLPVAQTFLLEDIRGRSLQSFARLDCLVTCVDVTALPEHISTLDTLSSRGWAAHETDKRTVADVYIQQIEFANVVLLNKIDLLPETGRAAEIEKAKRIVSVLNPSAKVLATTHSKVEASEVLNTNLFSLENAAQAPAWLQELNALHVSEIEELGISSRVFSSSCPFDADALSKFLEIDLLEEYNVLRSKGFAYFAQDMRIKLRYVSHVFYVEETTLHFDIECLVGVLLEGMLASSP